MLLTPDLSPLLVHQQYSDLISIVRDNHDEPMDRGRVWLRRLEGGIGNPINPLHTQGHKGQRRHIQLQRRDVCVS